MARILHTYDPPIQAEGGASYVARAVGRENGNVWEGWIEFVPDDGSPARRSERETTQPNLTDLEYWASGLTPIYLEGALRRALSSRQPAAPAPDPGSPVYDRPAPSSGGRASAERAVLDPFSVGAKGSEPLRKQLAALEAWHLRNIVRAYTLADERAVDLEGMSKSGLIELIVTRTEEALARVPAGPGPGV